MKVRTGNPNFVYEIACDQICGKSHFSMRGVIIVESQQEFDKWLIGEKPEFYKAFPDRDPNPTPGPKTDSTSTVAKPVAMATK